MSYGEASIRNLFDEDDGPGLSEVDKLKGEIEVLKEEKEDVQAELAAFMVDYDKKEEELSAANSTLDMLFMKRDEQLEEQKERIAELEQQVKDLKMIATPTSKLNGKVAFKL